MSSLLDGATLAQIKAACKELHLPSIGARTETTAQEAAREHAGHLDFLAALLEFELEDRAERRRARRIAAARFPRLKTLDDFRFADAPKVPAALIRDLATMSFIDKAENVILIGDSGTGKTHCETSLPGKRVVGCKAEASGGGRDSKDTLAPTGCRDALALDLSSRTPLAPAGLAEMLA